MNMKPTTSECKFAHVTTVLTYVHNMKTQTKLQEHNLQAVPIFQHVYKGEAKHPFILLLDHAHQGKLWSRKSSVNHLESSVQRVILKLMNVIVSITIGKS